MIAPDYLRGDELMILANCLANSQSIMVGGAPMLSPPHSATEH